MEKVFTIPLRKEFRKAPSYRHTKKAVKALREFVQKHMRVKEVKIGKNLNLFMWKNGRKNPPPRVKVKSIIEDDYARVELPDFPFEKKPTGEEKPGLKERLLGKKEEAKPEPEKPLEERAKEKPEKTADQEKEKIEKEEKAKKERELKERLKKEQPAEKPKYTAPEKAVELKEQEKEKLRKERIITRAKKRGRHEAQRE